MAKGLFVLSVLWEGDGPLVSSFLVKKRGETGVTVTAKHDKVWRSMNRTYPWGIRIAAKRFS